MKKRLTTEEKNQIKKKNLTIIYDSKIPAPRSNSKGLGAIILGEREDIILNIPEGCSYLFEFPDIDKADADEFRKFRIRVSKSIYKVNQYLSLVDASHKMRFVSRVEVKPLKTFVNKDLYRVNMHKGGVRVWRI